MRLGIVGKLALAAALVAGSPALALANDAEKKADEKDEVVETAPLETDEMAATGDEAKDGSLGLVVIGPPKTAEPELAPASGPVGVVTVAEPRGCAPRAWPDWQMAPDRLAWHGHLLGYLNPEGRRVRRTQ